ncbi:class I adenylate-forming enzyme family protein [Bradyrhizobium sp. McL0615]|uniref:class I adenylate-forming enzyme family protein n=1 Tax=Bradyrhizobium sp. McL0615 TaxID=3415673 RepID=UPI003CE71FA2
MRFVDYFRKGLMRGPDRLMLIGEERSYTHRQVDDLSSGIAVALAASGIGDGHKAAVFTPNDPLAFVSLLGIVRAGATWAPLNVRNGFDVNSAFLAFIECDCLFYHSSLEDEVEGLAAAVPSLRVFVCIDAEGRGGRLSLTEFLGRGTGNEPEVPDDPDRIVTIVSTGGTTGVPKGVQHTQRTWEHATFAFWTTMGTEDPIIHLAAAPLSHGAGALALMMLGGGATTVVLRKADPLSIIRAIETHRVTHMYLPPTVLYMMLAHPDVEKFDYSSLRYFSLAAAPVAPQKLREALRVFGPAMCQSFGQTEAPQLCTFLSPKEVQSADPDGHSNRLSSCGRATLGVRVEVMDDDGRILSEGQRGEIVVRGGLLFAGYYNNLRQTEETLKEGWLHTGDVGYRDDDGFFYIVDRKKDMIITGGFNVYSAEVEQVVLSHHAVRDCAVVGVPDPKWGEAIKAVVELKDLQNAPRDEIEKEIIEVVRERLGGVHAPKSVEFWPELPRSPNGKILKREIRSTFWVGQARAVG